MANIIKYAKMLMRKGVKADLPTLDEAELGLATDTKEVFVGTGAGNVQLAKQADVKDNQDKIGILQENFLSIERFPIQLPETNDTARLERAINFADSMGGGTIELRGGTTYTLSYIKLKKNVYVKGKGTSTILKVANGTNGHLVQLADDSVSRSGLINLLIDGNKANNTTGDAIYLNRSTIPNGSDYDSHLYFHKVRVVDVAGNGITIKNNCREGRYIDLVIHRCNGYGFKNEAGSDNWFDSITCYANNKAGFYENGTVNKWNLCKAFSNNLAMQGANRQVNIEGGFHITKGSNTFIGCEAQENYGSGFRIVNASMVTLSACKADANGITGSDQAAASDLLYSGVDIINSSNIMINGYLAADFRNASFGAKTQAYGITIDAPSSEIYVQGEFENQGTGIFKNDATATSILIFSNGKLYASTFNVTGNTAVSGNHTISGNLQTIGTSIFNNAVSLDRTGSKYLYLKENGAVRFSLASLGGASDSLQLNHHRADSSVKQLLNADYTTGNLSVGVSDASTTIKGANIGFFGSGGTSKPTITGSRGGNAAVADLLTKLAALGLITDNTSA